MGRRDGPYIAFRQQQGVRVFTCDAVELEFLNNAPIRLCAAVKVGRPPSEVFAAFAHDPANWRFIGVKFEETILAWDEGARWAFRVDRAQAPAFDAFVEDYHFEPDSSDATLLRWTIAHKPRLAFKLARPVLPRAMTLLLTRAGHNLEHGRWFSTRTDS